MFPAPPPLADCFQGFLFVTDFKRFDYDVPWCGFLCVSFTSGFIEVWVFFWISTFIVFIKFGTCSSILNIFLHYFPILGIPIPLILGLLQFSYSSPMLCSLWTGGCLLFHVFLFDCSYCCIIKFIDLFISSV